MNIEVDKGGKVTILNATFDFFIKKGWLKEALKLILLELKEPEKTKGIRLVAEEYCKKQLFKEAQEALFLLPPEEREDFPWMKAI
jgi:hypothetical protein